ncbi:MAG: DUF4091 domain-containing protein [Clostridia bacterium]|nr:DUF4091 domain-containing protein [Clostridia bacterium]
MKRSICFIIALTFVLSMFAQGTVSFADDAGSDQPGYSFSGDVNSYFGDEIELYVSIKNNPGIISLRNQISYDEEDLVLKKVENLGLLNGWTVPAANVKSPYILRWADSLAAENNDSNGDIVKLTFEALNPGSFTVTLSHIEARNVLGKKVAFNDASVKLEVSYPATGDADGDGEITDWDAMLFDRYLANWTIDKIYLICLDIDGDGEISDWDAMLLSRYLCGWNVELKPMETPTPRPTPEPTPEPTATPVPLGPISSTEVTMNGSKILSHFSGGNSVSVSLVDDADFGKVVKLSTIAATNDPYISFNIENYLKAYGFAAPSATANKVFVLKIRQENCSNTSCEVFYFSGNIYGPAVGYSRTRSFNNGEDGWQYLIYNMSDANGWTGNVHGFRFDFMFTAASAGESFYIGEILFFESLDDIADLLVSSEDLHALTDEQQLAASNLIESAVDNAPAVSNDKLTAADEDNEIDLWFDDAFVKTPQDELTSTGKNTYQIRMAKNEIEGCQFLLASSADKTGLKVNLSEFTDGSGNTLRHTICKGYYFDDVEGDDIVDPLPELKGSFDLAAGKSQMFLIKVYTDKTTPAGQYSAVLTIEDQEGKEVKKANVYVFVWKFTLPDASNCKILADLSWWNIYSYNPPFMYVGDDGLTYAKYYEYLLENKVNAYNIPYLDADKNHDDPFADERVDKYLNDPRVQAFNPVGFGTDKVTQTRIQSAYNYLKQNNEWLKKAYFYPIDEPKNKGELDQLIYYASLIKNVFGEDTKVIAPMHINAALDKDSTVDYFKYVEDYVNVWCPKTYFFNTMADQKNNPMLMTQYYTSILERNLGTFQDRMAAAQDEGDEVWWYVTRFPHHPEITLSISDSEIEHRLLFWQQKLYNVDGFLYYLVNDWNHGDDQPWGKKHEVDNSYPYNVYGNGVLVYNGFEDSEGQPYTGRERYNELEDKSFNAFPVGSMRLESVRDGAEDYDYFTILDNYYGEGTSDLIIKQITTSLGNYSTDGELYNQLRIAVGNLISAKIH